MLVDDLNQFSVEVVAPGVVATPDALLGESAVPVGETSAAVQAGVMEGADGLPVRPNDQDRLVADEVLAEVADLGYLLLATGDLPDARPEALELQLGKLGAGVTLSGNGVVLTDQHALEIHVVDLLQCTKSPHRGQSARSVAMLERVGMARDGSVAGGRAAPASILRLPPGTAVMRGEVEIRRHRGESVKGEWSVMVIGGPDGAS